MTDRQETMRAVAATRPGGPEVLVVETRPRPLPGAGEVLIKVEAAGVNRPDVLQRMGFYAPPPGASDILGLEVAGPIVARGPGAARYPEGARVTALVPGGGYADYCVAHESNALPWPLGLTAVEAAAIPETYFTVWTNVFDRGALKAGETLLVHGGTSGIGTTAIQLAKAFGAKVIATAGVGRKGRANAFGSAPMSASITAPTILSPKPLRLRAEKAPTSSSTWSAATMSRATTPPPRWTAGSSRLRSCAGRQPRSIFGRSCTSG